MTTHAPRTDTRARIIDAALDLFSEQGYEKTSLRELADRLGVTKAALYYHFHTKEDILISIAESMSAPIDEAIAWGSAQEWSPEVRDETIRRYVTGMAGNTKLLRFFHENQPAIRQLSVGDRFRERMGALNRLLVGPEPTFEDQVRARLALLSSNIINLLAEGGPHTRRWMGGEDDEPLPTEAERLEVGLRVALELVAPIHP